MARWMMAAAAAAALTGPAWALPPEFGDLPEPIAPLDAASGASDYLACLDEGDITIVSGHRGGPEPGYPENAIETFANTLAQAPMMIETDVRQTADGVYVLIHDETLERTTTGTGRVDETDWAELRTYALIDNDGAETPFRTPTLAEALAWAEGRTFLQLDIKRGVDIAEVTRFVAQAGAVDRAAIIAYTVEDAVAAANAHPTISLSIGIEDRETLEALLEAGIARERLMAWTGVAEEPRPEVWAMLEAEGVPAAFGALWYMDGEVAESGDPSIYAALAEMGVDVLSSHLHQLAYQTIEEVQDTVAAVNVCTGRLGN